MSDSDDERPLPTKRRKLESKGVDTSTNSIGFKLPHGTRGGGEAISRIKNKCKRTQIYQQAKHVAKKAASKARRKRQKEHELLGDDAPPKQEPKTLDNTREKDDTMVDGDDEVEEDEKIDEFAAFFNGQPAKIMITSNFAKRPSVLCHTYIEDLMAVFPNSAYYKRGTHEMKKIVDQAIEREFTDIVVITEKQKTPNGLTLIHLPNGPTATFKLKSIVLAKDVFNHARPTDHEPELILNNFSTRLGHRIGRFFTSLLPQVPQFEGRRVVTFHNQRDYIFFRHHRYIFENIWDVKGPGEVVRKPTGKNGEIIGKRRVRLQEIGPRFCLKLKALQLGTFDTKFGEYEWVHRLKLDTSRRLSLIHISEPTRPY
eukprot:TRINITY_DN28045_c0_g1_i1.p2 TRINITY_DN28045_c0_g1~~TRINITY_DN28045_c0_g1_i1.p2  ORF type:complete len:370 (+),score=77.65 TRINITY_DN28045_c0_g1_i1:137-1246(+)